MTLLLILLLAGLCLPEPPGILGALLEYHIFGGKQRASKERKKWQEINRIEAELKKEGKTLHDEFKLANQGKSKHFKKL